MVGPEYAQFRSESAFSAVIDFAVAYVVILICRAIARGFFHRNRPRLAAVWAFGIAAVLQSATNYFSLSQIGRRNTPPARSDYTGRHGCINSCGSSWTPP
jgi:hypothetical protein